MEEEEEEHGGGEVGGHWELWLGTADWELWEERREKNVKYYYVFKYEYLH